MVKIDLSPSSDTSQLLHRHEHSWNLVKPAKGSIGCLGGFKTVSKSWRHSRMQMCPTKQTAHQDVAEQVKPLQRIIALLLQSPGLLYGACLLRAVEQRLCFRHHLHMRALASGRASGLAISVRPPVAKQCARVAENLTYCKQHKPSPPGDRAWYMCRSVRGCLTRSRLV